MTDDTAPYLLAIPTGQLFTDPTYQRECDVNRANRMAADWNPRLAGVLDVSDRGKHHTPRYAIINGQHRWRAAQRTGADIPLVCNVHTGHIYLGTGLNDDCPTVDNTDARLIVDDDSVRVDVPLDLGDLGDTVLHIELDDASVIRCARLMLAHTYDVDERLYDLDALQYVTVRECANDNGALLVAGPNGQYRISAARLTRPPTPPTTDAALDRVAALADAWEACGMQGGHPSPQYMAGLLRKALAGDG